MAPICVKGPAAGIADRGQWLGHRYTLAMCIESHWRKNKQQMINMLTLAMCIESETANNPLFV